MYSDISETEGEICLVKIDNFEMPENVLLQNKILYEQECCLQF